MSLNISKLTQEEIVAKIIDDSLDVNQLSMNIKDQRTAFFTAVKSRPYIVTKIKSDNLQHFILPLLKSYPNYFVYLDSNQYTDQFLQLYLMSKFTQDSDKKNQELVQKNSNFSVQNSIDGKILFNYEYTTQNGEEISYYDNEFCVPVSLRSSFKVTLKLNDSLELLNKMDLHITQIGANKIKTIISDIVLNQYYANLTNYIAKNKLGYYSLSSSLIDLESYFEDKLGHVFKKYGIEVKEFLIKQIAIPKDIQYKIEDQAFQIRQLRAEFDANNEFAKKSLENYEEKLSIQEKYPSAEHSLTEYEKDLALNRYLIKVGRATETEINHAISINHKADVKDSAVKKVKDIVPDIPKKRNSFVSGFITWFFVLLFLSFVLYSAGPSVGTTSLIIVIVLFSIIGLFNVEKFKTNKTPIEPDKESGNITTTNTPTINNENNIPATQENKEN